MTISMIKKAPTVDPRGSEVLYTTTDLLYAFLTASSVHVTLITMCVTKCT